MDGQTISADDKIRLDILLKEYDTLRTEIIARIRIRWSLTSYALAAVAAVAGFSGFSPWAVGGVAVTAAAGVGWMWVRSWRLMRRCGRRIAEIEARVNALAGDELLVWETRLLTTKYQGL